jgi:hypothetical protein
VAAPGPAPEPPGDEQPVDDSQLELF